jgi:alpha-tubulin suppressor-like RCC1 family protein
VGAATNWMSVAVGDGNIMAIKADGTLWGFGDNGFGQVGCGGCPSGVQGAGVGSFTQVDEATNWASVAAGGGHTIATRTDGTLWGWRQNSSGEAGNDLPPDGVVTPTQIGTDTTWARPVAAGVFHSLAVDAG